MAYATSLETEAPDVAQFMSQLTITVPVISEWIKRISYDGEDAATVAADWVAANDTLIRNEWLAGIDLAN